MSKKANLAPDDIELLIDGLNDDVAFVWVLIHLGIRGNPPTNPGPPSRSELDAAFAALERLVHAKLVKVGRIEYVDGRPPGSLHPVKHVEEPTSKAKARVIERCESGSDWEWSCWVVNLPAGDRIARGQPKSEE